MKSKKNHEENEESNEERPKKGHKNRIKIQKKEETEEKQEGRLTKTSSTKKIGEKLMEMEKKGIERNEMMEGKRKSRTRVTKKTGNKTDPKRELKMGAIKV